MILGHLGSLMVTFMAVDPRARCTYARSCDTGGRKSYEPMRLAMTTKLSFSAHPPCSKLTSSAIPTVVMRLPLAAYSSTRHGNRLSACGDAIFFYPLERIETPEPMSIMPNIIGFCRVPNATTSDVLSSVCTSSCASCTPML